MGIDQMTLNIIVIKSFHHNIFLFLKSPIFYNNSCNSNPIVVKYWKEFFIQKKISHPNSEEIFKVKQTHLDKFKYFFLTDSIFSFIYSPRYPTGKKKNSFNWVILLKLLVKEKKKGKNQKIKRGDFFFYKFWRTLITKIHTHPTSKRKKNQKTKIKKTFWPFKKYLKKHKQISPNL